MLPETRISAIRAGAESGGKQLPVFRVDIVDSRGGPVAHVRKTVYVRRKRALEPVEPLDLS
jgi:hypothetical protein